MGTAPKPWIVAALLGDLVTGVAWAAPITVEKVACFSQPNCYKLANGVVEVVVTTNIGPRVMRYGFVGGENVLGESSSSGPRNEWRAYGGHRLWTAPEAKPRSYSPDNDPIEYHVEGGAIRLTQPVEPTTGIQKEITVSLDGDGTGVTVHHRLTNRGPWGIEVAPWAMTITQGGGVAIIPQEPRRSHAEALLPARPMALWHYTDLTDSRLTLGRKYARVRTDAARSEPLKIGFGNKQGWAAYHRNGTLFLKRYPHVEGAVYPDYGCNTEIFTRASFIEVESLGPLRRLEPGASTTHVEHWNLFRDVDLGATEDALDAAIRPLVAQTKGPDTTAQ